MTTDSDIDGYETHEAWLVRQRETLALIDQTIADLPGGPPEPRKLPPLPAWKDGQRINGEAQNVMDAASGFGRRFTHTLVAMFVAFARSPFAAVLAVLFGLWLLFAAGALLFNLTVDLL